LNIVCNESTCVNSFLGKRKSLMFCFFLKREIFEKRNLVELGEQHIHEYASECGGNECREQNIHEYAPECGGNVCYAQKSINKATNPGENTSSSNKKAPGAIPEASY
jgi:hypothetical protein